MNPEYLWNVWNRMLRSPLPEFASGLLSSSVICAAIGIVIGAAISLSATRLRHRGFRAGTALRRERIGIGVTALAVGVGWMGDIALRGYVLDMTATISWWRFGVAPAVTAAGLIAWGVTCRTREPRRAFDTASATRRSWMTFGPRRATTALLALAAVAVGIALVFGSMSTALEPGPAAHVSLEAPNIDAPPVVMLFPGWAYGIPMLGGVVALAVAVVFALHRNAVRSFSSGIRLDVQRSQRSDAARGVVELAAAALLVTLGGILRLARSAAVTTFTSATDSGGEATVHLALPHADLIMVGGFAAPLLEIAGCAMLTLLVVRAAVIVGARRRYAAEPAAVGA